MMLVREEGVKTRKFVAFVLVLIVHYIGIIVVEVKAVRGFMVGGGCAVLFVVVPW